MRSSYLVGLAALVARLAFVTWAGRTFPPVEDGIYYHTLAQRLAQGDGYTWLWPDGAVTFVAHYPVGYPALVALLYAVFGAVPAAAMALNAVLGAAAAVAVCRLCGGSRGIVAGLVVALHPALVPYTAAVMTEGVTASILVLAVGLTASARGSWWRLAAVGLVLGIATLIRPQNLLFAPLFGLLGARKTGRLAGATLVFVVAVGVCLPWTVRNCVRMERCALVSMNGGWNLLIGTHTGSGGFTPVAVPAACATVWSESEKDLCFERAARLAILRDPWAFVAKVPSKLAMTFDYLGAGPWYLHASNPLAFSAKAKVALGAAETVAVRGILAAALIACARLRGAHGRLRWGLAVVGLGTVVTVHAYVAYLCFVGTVLGLGRRRLGALPVLIPCAAVVVLGTALTHAMFFGAGRYGLVVVPLVTAVAFVKPRPS